jgi:hypothetical protein
MFSVRLVVADHYMSPPIPELDVGYSEFRGTEVKQVPVIRVFGSTVTGILFMMYNKCERMVQQSITVCFEQLMF